MSFLNIENYCIVCATTFQEYKLSILSYYSCSKDEFTGGSFKAPKHKSQNIKSTSTDVEESERTDEDTAEEGKMKMVQSADTFVYYIKVTNGKGN